MFALDEPYSLCGILTPTFNAAADLITLNLMGADRLDSVSIGL